MTKRQKRAIRSAELGEYRYKPVRHRWLALHDGLTMLRGR